jgi:hypothetical protein
MSTHRHRDRNLRRLAARELDRIAATLPDHPDRHVVQDIANYLAARRPDPGSAFPPPAGRWPR